MSALDEQQSAYLTTEMSELRRQINEISQLINRVQLFAVTSAGAVYAIGFGYSDIEGDWWKRSLFVLPPVLNTFLYFQYVSLWQEAAEIRDYIVLIERRVLGHVSGYTRFYRARRSERGKSSVRRVRTFWWLGLTLIPVFVGVSREIGVAVTSRHGFGMEDYLLCLAIVAPALVSLWYILGGFENDPR
ncbi:hypothetical protein JET14_15730 [Martelella lutilitoris]|uniref:Uncharacterized protein n=1 Tax=Martelella lutilitoris TaxID=2583532 RepID=A0A7T7HIB5_9HYPH|nr:hypothetical protein [Martelella lutilitoris]QQM29738.1 hypothetical protein JET14_15730 [Martelella lutilitoris]